MARTAVVDAALGPVGPTFALGVDTAVYADKGRAGSDLFCMPLSLLLSDRVCAEVCPEDQHFCSWVDKAGEGVHESGIGGVALRAPRFVEPAHCLSMAIGVG